MVGGQYSIWKVHGFAKQKIKFLFGCCLIVPIFHIRKHNKLISWTLENLIALRSRLCNLIRYRQNIVTILYNIYKDDTSSIINELALSIIDNDIDIHNMMSVEVEIESLHEIIHSYRITHRVINEAYDSLLDYSYQEYQLLLQAYQAIYSACILKNKRIPWSSYLKIFNLKEFYLSM
ncbi:MAG: hypothetical protein LBG49_02750 [Mycoplasmataceae bacterium]|nr:hypothetical protein [Mycoplasmataceae bacterium]